MKLYFIVDNSIFFIPDWLEKSICHLIDNNIILGISILNPPKNSITWKIYIYKNILNLDFIQLCHICIKILENFSQQIFYYLKINQKPNNIYQIAKKYRLPIDYIDNVNDYKFLVYLNKLKPDIIISSCSQIFNKALLKLPKIFCINRHSSLLPSYCGVLPIFWAILKKEKYIGVTIHKMTEKIDRGKIIYQKKISIHNNDTLFSLYQKAYHESVNALVAAIKIIKKKHKYKIYKNIKPSYSSFPSQNEWKKFFQLGNKFI